MKKRSNIDTRNTRNRRSIFKGYEYMNLLFHPSQGYGKDVFPFKETSMTRKENNPEGNIPPTILTAPLQIA